MYIEKHDVFRPLKFDKKMYILLPFTKNKKK